MASSADKDNADAGQHPGQQTDTGTGHGVKGQGGQEESKGVPDAHAGDRERGADAEQRERG